MRSILLFTFTFFLTACSDNSTNNNKTAPSNVSADKSVEQQVAVQTEPIKSVSKPAPVKTETEATAKKAAPVKGHTVFAHKCASCHGNNAEKAALNKSQVIEGWDKERIVNALKGYQDGSYGSSMKGIMKGQASALSDEQIEAVAGYISTL